MDLVEAAWDEHRPPDPELIKDCVHCGFCLPTCPSYLTFEEEMDSPRGRIVLMRVGHEDAELSDEMVTHFDRCLGCMACVTACPSGVQYDKLIEQVRPQIERHADRPLAQRAWRRGIFELFTHPGRLRALVPVLALQQKSGLNDALGKLPIPKLQSLLGLAPDVPASAAFRQLPKLTPARGESRGRIALMQGCINRVFFGDVNAATVRVLAAEGFEVHAPRQPRCCGSLMMHAGLEDEALALARETIAAYEDFDAIAVNVAGCGSGMKDYAHLLADDPEWAERAEAFSAKVKDVSASCSPTASRASCATHWRSRSPTTTPATSPTPRACASRRASSCVRFPTSSWSSPTSGRSAAARPGSTTSCSRRPPPSWASARPTTSPPPSPTRSPPATRGAPCRSLGTWIVRSRSCTR